jgi:MYXO-CTERM domain-containing protein
MRRTTLFFIHTIVSSVLFLGALPTHASAQRSVAYDTVSMETPAAISCGFCGGEKFGVIFRELTAGGGLLPSEFPLTINSFKIAVASAEVTGDGVSMPLMCMGSAAGGTIGVMLEAFAGETAPMGDIVTRPVSGPWAGETMVFSQSVELERSVETTPGSAMYEVMINTIDIDGGAMVAPPNTYVRVVATIPAGGASSSCDLLGLSPPGAVGIRDDDGRIENNIGFIYALNPLGGVFGIAEGWHWNESSEIEDPTTGEAGIGGDWLIRMDVMPASGPRPDAGMTSDGGITDTGTPVGDTGTPPTGCTADSECAGGERCSSGVCTRVSCTTATECGGGMTCVEGRCRGLCSTLEECAGGEVCDAVMGYCVPAGGRDDDGGCGCRVSRPRSMHAPALFAALALFAFVRRRRR